MPKQDKENATIWHFRPVRLARSKQAGNPLFYYSRKRFQTLAAIVIQLNFPSEKVVDRATEIMFQLD